MRGYGSMSSSGPTAREKELPKLANGGSVQSDDRTLPIGDGWEKSKMKKKRSIIKLDSAAVSTKPLDGYREPKQGIQQRSFNNARPRLNSDSHGPRYVFLEKSLPCIIFKSSSNHSRMLSPMNF